jgi:hypothetical protein
MTSADARGSCPRHAQSVSLENCPGAGASGQVLAPAHPPPVQQQPFPVQWLIHGRSRIPFAHDVGQTGTTPQSELFHLERTEDAGEQAFRARQQLPHRPDRYQRLEPAVRRIFEDTNPHASPTMACAKETGSKGSISSKVSPRPTYCTPTPSSRPTARTAPPLAVPSSFAITMPVSSSLR